MNVQPPSERAASLDVSRRYVRERGAARLRSSCMANTQGSQGTGSSSGMKSDRDQNMTQQSGSGQHSQQSDRMKDANERTGGQGGSTQQSGSGSGRGQESNSGP